MRLRSASRRVLYVPRHRHTFGRRAFAVAGPTAWNTLPDVICYVAIVILDVS